MDAVGAWRESGGVAVEQIEVIVLSEPSDEVEGVAHSGLSGLVADVSGEYSVLDDAGDARDHAFDIGEEHVATAGAEDHDEIVRLSDACARYAGVCVDDGGGDGGSGVEAEPPSGGHGEFSDGDGRRREAAGVFVRNGVGECGADLMEVLWRREAMLGGPAGLVAGLAGRAWGRVAADEAPDEPVSGFDPELSGLCDVRGVVDDFERLWQEPLDADDSAVAREPGFVSLSCDLVDASSLFECAVVFPEFWPGVRLGGEVAESGVGGKRVVCEAERDAVARAWEHGATGEIDADAGDVAWRDGGGFESGTYGEDGGVDPVGGVLEGEIGGEGLREEA